MADVMVLRIGHRPERDKRITTHVALSSRALGARGIIVNTRDDGVERSVRSVVERFGGTFTIETGVGWRHVLDSWKGKTVHLTMYGMPLKESLESIPSDEPLLVIVGAEKVPPEIYQRADFNISVGNQPHSEVAALAIFLDRYFQGEELERDLGGKLMVIPSERGKHVEERPSLQLPSRDECLLLLEEAGCSRSVVEHCISVEKVASTMALLSPDADKGLVRAGSLLHDVGRGITHDVHHCYEGARFAEEKGLEPILVSIIRKHVGAGLDDKERVLLGLPPGDYIPATLEEKLVAHADNLVADNACRSLSEVLEKFRRKGLDFAADRTLELHRELEDVLGVKLEELCSRVLSESRSPSP